MVLPLANILHHKLRSALSALGIGVGVCMLITLGALSRGSLYEIADRWESVDAELIVFPRIFGDGAVTSSGPVLSDRYAERIREQDRDIVQRVAAVYAWPVRIAGQDHVAAGVDPNDLRMFLRGRGVAEGRVYDPNGAFSDWLTSVLLEGAHRPPAEAGQGEPTDVLEITSADLSRPGRNGLEVIVDSRLADAGRLRVGQRLQMAGHDFTVVGIVPAGAMSRVFLPRRTAQFLFGDGNVTRSTMLFVKLQPGVDANAARDRLVETTKQRVIPVSHYRRMLESKFGVMFVYVDAVNAIAMVIAFLFISVMLFTMVLQRTREIAILKSCGASWWFLLRQVLAEAMLLAAAGAAAGVAMSFAAAWVIQTARPLLTVTITWRWIAVALIAAAAGAAVSAVLPGVWASRVDMAEALALE